MLSHMASCSKLPRLGRAAKIRILVVGLALVLTSIAILVVVKPYSIYLAFDTLPLVGTVLPPSFVPENFESILRNHADGEKNVIMTIADAGFISTLDSWVKTLQAHSPELQKHVIGLHLDKIAEEAFRRNNITSIPAGHWFQDYFHTDRYHQCDALKAHFSSSALSLGYNVLVCDADAFIVKNPFEFLCKDSDFEFLSDVHSGPLHYGDPNINAGLWYARCSDRPCIASRVLNTWLRALLDEPSSFGQGILNSLVRGGKVLESASSVDQQKDDFDPGEAARICDVYQSSYSFRSWPTSRLLHPRVFAFEGNVLRNYSSAPAIVHVALYKGYSMLTLGFERSFSDLQRLRNALPALTYTQDWSGSVRRQRELFLKALVLGTMTGRTVITPPFDCSLHPDRKHMNLTRNECALLLFYNTDTLAQVFDIQSKLLPHRFLGLLPSTELNMTQFSIHGDASLEETTANSSLTFRSVDEISVVVKNSPSDVIVLEDLKNMFVNWSDPVAAALVQHLQPSWHYFQNSWGLWERYGFVTPGGQRPADSVQNCTWRGDFWSCGNCCNDTLPVELNTWRVVEGASYQCICRVYVN
eukprot:comp61336_c0_seq1/m.47892 comp61336_c0_seq1/g.47892  ORF comp61336_c0_seq1/g.47892 comp61336_c0_seq1/m.47892 type:complete len:585 (-) comp61336_c0_seq1:152-1906(-)